MLSVGYFSIYYITLSMYLRSVFSLYTSRQTQTPSLLELRFVVLGMDFVVIHFTVFNKWKKPLYLESNSCI